MSGRGAGLGATTRGLQRNYSDPVREFTDWLHAEFGNAPDVVPGKLQRFDHPDGRRGNGRCWCKLFDDCRGGVAGDWREGSQVTWTAYRAPLTREDRERTRRAAEAARRQRAQEAEKRHQAAAATARDIWERAAPATTEHDYLRRKRVPALCARVLGRELLVPLRTVDGELVNLQRIYPDGGKRFLPGGRITGAFCLLASELPERGELYICEGWATAATIHAQTRLPVAAAMNAGNLQPVAEAIRKARPLLSLVVAADNDHRTEGNPGIRYGRQAARAVDAALTWPNVCGQPDCTCTDYNDVQHCGRAPA